MKYNNLTLIFLVSVSVVLASCAGQSTGIPDIDSSVIIDVKTEDNGTQYFSVDIVPEDVSEDTLDYETFTFIEGSLLGDNISRFLAKHGYQEKVVLENFKEDCDWKVPYSFDVTYTDPIDSIASILEEKGFSDFEVLTKSKVLKARYFGSRMLLKTCGKEL